VQKTWLAASLLASLRRVKVFGSVVTAHATPRVVPGIIAEQSMLRAPSGGKTRAVYSPGGTS
jgi:hypothetical protein